MKNVRNKESILPFFPPLDGLSHLSIEFYVKQIINTLFAYAYNCHLKRVTFMQLRALNSSLTLALKGAVHPKIKDTSFSSELQCYLSRLFWYELLSFGFIASPSNMMQLDGTLLVVLQLNNPVSFQNSWPDYSR